MLIKKIFMTIAFVVFYQIGAMVSLYNSSVFNLAAYYTHPPLIAGDVGYQRLPMLWGEQAAIYFLRGYKKREINELVDDGQLSLASILTSYEGGSSFDENEARSRAMTIASAVIKNGYDLRKCEGGGNTTTAGILKAWGKLDDMNSNFLLKYIPKAELFSCSNKNGGSS